MYLETLENPIEWIQMGTKIDLFRTSNDSEIIKIINTETRVEPAQTDRETQNSPQKTRDKCQSEKRFADLCMKLQKGRENRFIL